VRVLRLYHSAVVSEYRQREKFLQSRFGHEVSVASTPSWNEGGRSVEAEVDPNLDAVALARRGPEHPILFWYSSAGLRALVRRVQPELVDLHEEPYSLSVAAALRVLRREAPTAAVCIYTAQNIYKRYPHPFRALERRALQAADAVYSCSSEASDVIKRKGFEGDLRVIPLGVSVPAETGGKRNDPPIVGFVGRLEPYKGGRIAVGAFASATEGTQARLEIIGSGSELAELRRLARELKVDQRVDFLGALPQDLTLQRIARQDLMLIPSQTTPTWKEQFGRVAAQALALGTPVIASDSGSLREVVGDAGVLVQERDIPGFAFAIRRLLDDEPARVWFQRAGYTRAAGRFDWPVVASAFHEMYGAALHRRSGRR
jgi:glycosyltransferase involved in cell wall biosynthesis